MQVKEEIEALRRDLRYTRRQLLHNPVFAFAAVLTVALAVGAATVIFSAADALLLRPLPYPDSRQLVLVWNMLAKIGVKHMQLSAEDFDAFRTNSHVFQSTVAFQQQDRTLIVSGHAERVSTISSTPSILEMLGGTSTIGRSLHEGDWQPDRSQVAIISYPLFRRRFAANQRVIGQTIRLDDRVYTVVGVLPRDFEFSMNTGSVDVWTPLAPVADGRKAQFAMLARLNPGVDIRTAQESITATAKHLEKTAHPYQGPNGEDPGFSATVLSLHDHLFGGFRTAALILMSTVLLLLLIASVNVANLLIARGAAREKELAVRRLLGASRVRLIRQWMTEAAVLAVLGGGIGLLASRWGILLLKTLTSGDVPGIARIGINERVLVFTCAISVLICLVFTVAPLLSSTMSDGTLRGPSRRRRISNMLVSTEVALALVLIVTSGLLLKSFDHLRKIDPGFRSDHLLTMEINLSGPRYEQAANRIQFLSHLQERLEQLPGVISSSATNQLPVFTVGVDTRYGNPFSVDGHPFDPNRTAHQVAHTPVVGGNYFRTMGIPLIEGRTFSDTDTADTPPVTVVNQTLEHNIFPNGDALGKRILLGMPAPGARWMTIVGIIGDVRTGALDLPAMPQFYTPAKQNTPSGMFIIMRTRLDPLQMKDAAASAVHQLDPEQPVEHIETMEDHVNETMGQPWFQTSLLSFFAMTALFLAAIGIYGVVTHATIQRTKEMGIRMALGADRSTVLVTVLVDGLRPVLCGIGAGLAMAAVLTRFLISSLYGVRPNDPMTIVAAGVLMASVAIVACLSPARLATLVDPIVTLRYE